MSIYLCNYCGSGYLDSLRTGNLFGSCGQRKKFRTHTASRPRKLVNGVFWDASTGAYLQTACQIAESGFVEIETGGCANAYLDFRKKVGDIELSGSGIIQLRAFLSSRDNALLVRDDSFDIVVSL